MGNEFKQLRQFAVMHEVPDNAEAYIDQIQKNIEEGNVPCYEIGWRPADDVNPSGCSFNQDCEFCVLNEPWLAELWMASLSPKKG